MVHGVMRVWRRFARTQLWRAWRRYGAQRGNRLAGATTFFGFLSMFPLIVLAAAVIGRLLNEDAVRALKRSLQENLPGIVDKIDIDGLIANAGTIGLISGATLLLTGLGWIDAMRASIRSMHELDDQPGNLVKLKLADFGALLGLGAIGLFGTAATSVLGSLSERVVDWLDLEGSWVASWGLDAIRYVLGVLSGALLFGYLQTGMPRIALPRKVLLIVALAGGVVFVGAQGLGGLYVDRVIGNNQAYGALALPLALLVWIYLITRIVMLIAAWAKEATIDHDWHTGEAERAAKAALPVVEPAVLPAYRTVEIPQRKADTVAVAAGAVLGVTATAITMTAARAARTALSALRRR
jgi:membrane protein